MMLISDIDGTLADDRHRHHFIPDWDAYHELAHLDKPYVATFGLVAEWSELAGPERLVIFTARPERYREETTQWLEAWGLAEHDDYRALLMRANDDYRSAAEVKLDQLKAITQALGMEPEAMQSTCAILEDNTKNVEVMRDAGWTVWQVGENKSLS